MTAVYRGMDRASLDAAYDNSAAVGNSALLLAVFDDRSRRLRAGMPQHLDLRYGLAERNRIDYFAGAKGAPVLVFVIVTSALAQGSSRLDRRFGTVIWLS